MNSRTLQAIAVMAGAAGLVGLLVTMGIATRADSQSSYGAGSVGEINEPCTTVGTRATPSTLGSVMSASQPGTIILLRSGVYPSFTVKAGSNGNPVIVKPYNCEAVSIEGHVGFDSNTVLAGVLISATTERWAVRVGPGKPNAPIRNVTLRNATVRGGTIDSVRIDGYVENVDIEDCDLDGGLRNHVVKVRANGGSPSNVILKGNLFHKDAAFTYGTTEDLFQAEGANSVVLDHNTFGPSNEGRHEDGVDIKSGAGPNPSFTARGNLFLGATIDTECLVIQATRTTNLVESNYFEKCGPTGRVSVGASNTGYPQATFRENLFNESGVRFRRSTDSVFEGNIMNGGVFQFGTSEAGDRPHDLHLLNNTFNGTVFKGKPSGA